MPRKQSSSTTATFPTPDIDSSGAPMPPETLSTVGAAFWLRNADTLHDAGLLTPADYDAFEIACEAYAAWRKATKDARGLLSVVEADPQRPGMKRPDPLFTQEREAAKAAAWHLAAFGMTPAGRSKAAPADKKKPGRKGKTLDEYMN